MHNPGLIHIALKNRAICPAGRFHSVPAGFAWMPVRKPYALRISSLTLLMRNPGLTKIFISPVEFVNLWYFGFQIASVH